MQSAKLGVRVNWIRSTSVSVVWDPAPSSTYSVSAGFSTVNCSNSERRQSAMVSEFLVFLTLLQKFRIRLLIFVHYENCSSHNILKTEKELKLDSIICFNIGS